MTNSEIKDKIIEKQDELIKIYEDYVIGNEIEGFEWERDFQKPANTLINELASLKSQLSEAGEEKRPTYDVMKRIAIIYKESNPHDRAVIAKICDETLDRSGRLLGEIRELAAPLKG